ncbi:MAG TPA: M1 family metallopeptidase [Balneolaceae bacterium]|nr:M1 family metallopeptidase [Balneolaceae bacterium]
MKFLMKSFKFCILLIVAVFISQPTFAQETQFTRADTLRGSITPQRAWWEVVYYDLNVTVMPQDSAIRGYNKITYRVIDEPVAMQIDLQQPLRIDQITQNGQKLDYHRVGQSAAYFVDVPRDLMEDSLYTITVYYHGQPIVAERPPWDGGFVWTQDSLGNPWVTTAVQGLGASAWWPNKDHQSAEPDSMSINITVPDPMVDVSNGRLRDVSHHENGMTTYSWFVSNPINNYTVAVNAGNYVNFTDTYEGKKGTLDLSYWVLESDLKKAKEQFQQVKPMMRCFEKWFGPYPFYEDSFKLVQVPYLGMEHQSAVAYGNHFENGYLGTDLSGTGWGLKWDFIIIHESAHEWWGNSITSKDIADMWVHESFANYAEGIYTECLFGEKAGAEYIIGLRDRIQNDRPIIGEYGVNYSGSGDMYYKGSNMLHTIRHIISDDSTWKSILLGLQKDFRHQTVTGQQIENYINERVEYDLDPVFDQYLRHTEIPVFQYYIENGTLHYRWMNVIEDFDMPIKVTLDEGSYSFIHPIEGKWKTAEINLENPDSFKVNKNFYVKVGKVNRDSFR